MSSNFSWFYLTNEINNTGSCDSVANFVLTPLRWAAGGKTYNDKSEKVDDSSTSSCKSGKKIAGVILAIVLFPGTCTGLILKEIAWRIYPETGKRYQNIFDKYVKKSSLAPNVQGPETIFSYHSSENKPSASTVDTPHEVFIQGLLKWLPNKPSKNELESYCRMRYNYEHPSLSLKLGKLGLTSLPPEIGQLTSIRYLCLKENKLNILPAEIGQLTLLEELDLQKNCLTSLPIEIWNLTSLTYLGLGDNSLTTLPAEIGQLTLLKKLDLGSGPAIAWQALSEYGTSNNVVDMCFLTRFFYGSNKFTGLPAELGNLTSLQVLNLTGIFELRELPLSLGNLPELTHIYTVGTSIPSTVLEHILDHCKTLRGKKYSNDLPNRLNLWSGYAGKSSDLLSFILDLRERDQISINEWLLRLTITNDFARRQHGLAKTVCQVLKSLQTSKDFSKKFFDEIEHNNERCQDRAAMTFNLVYTHWRIHSLEPGASLTHALKIVAGVSRTFALRKALAMEMVGHNIGESVEVYLYYEQQLKDRLSLETAMESMSYNDIGRRNWINEDILIEQVEDNYLNIMAEFFLENKTLYSIVKQDSSYSKGWELQDKEFYLKQEQLEERMEKVNSEEYYNQCKKIQFEREKALNAYTVEWLKSQLSSTLR